MPKFLDKVRPQAYDDEDDDNPTKPDDNAPTQDQPPTATDKQPPKP